MCVTSHFFLLFRQEAACTRQYRQLPPWWPPQQQYIMMPPVTPPVPVPVQQPLPAQYLIAPEASSASMFDQPTSSCPAFDSSGGFI